MIEEFIENHPVFTRQELLDACGDNQTNSNLLSRAKKSGKVVSIVKGVYASNTGRYRANETSPYAVANKLGEDVTYAYGSALSLLTGSHDVSYRVVFFSRGRSIKLNWNGREYIGYPSPEYMSIRERRLPDGVSVRFTDKEQTILDCLSRPDRCGGAEALLRGLSAIAFVDTDRLVDGTISRSMSTVAKLGWLLESKRKDWDVPKEALDKLQQEIAGRGPFYFSRRHEIFEDSWCSKWRLYLPASEEECERWLEG